MSFRAERSVAKNLGNIHEYVHEDVLEILHFVFDYVLNDKMWKYFIPAKTEKEHK